MTPMDHSTSWISSLSSLFIVGPAEAFTAEVEKQRWCHAGKDYKIRRNKRYSISLSESRGLTKLAAFAGDSCIPRLRTPHSMPSNLPNGHSEGESIPVYLVVKRSEPEK